MNSINAALRSLLNAHPERARDALVSVIAILPDLENDSNIRASVLIDQIASVLSDDAA